MRTAVLKRTTLRDQVFEAILNVLKSGELAPGTRITEEKLAQRLEVSRTPIREALGQLARQGLLQPRRGGGFVAPSPTVEEVRNIIAVRMLLEPPAVRMAAEEYGPAQIERVAQAIKDQAAAASKGDPGPFARANEEFRRAIFDDLANRALSRLIGQFDSHLHFIRAVTLKDLALRKKIVARQLRIRDALRRGDGARTEDLWRDYLRFTEAVLTHALEEINRERHESSE